MDLLKSVKTNLSIKYNDNDGILQHFITVAVDYTESYQCVPKNYYQKNEMSTKTQSAVIILISHFYELCVQGKNSTANISTSSQIWNTVNSLLRFDSEQLN